MKKIVLFAAIMALSISSCSKNDDDQQAELIGKWEFSQLGTIVMGQEFLSPYQHQANCGKDFIQFDQTIAIGHFYDEITCVDDTDVNSYVRNGNIISIMVDGTVETAEIITLNASTLKLKYAEIANGEAQYSTTVFVRK